MGIDTRQYYVYIMTNKADTVFYTGVTNNLLRRVQEHRNKLVDGFTKRYRITELVYFEAGDSIEGAILREKQIKAGSRRDKIKLITGRNPGWNDLYNELLGDNVIARNEVTRQSRGGEVLLPQRLLRLSLP